jgi:hypothetical protein
MTRHGSPARSSTAKVVSAAGTDDHDIDVRQM